MLSHNVVFRNKIAVEVQSPCHTHVSHNIWMQSDATIPCASDCIQILRTNRKSLSITLWSGSNHSDYYELMLICYSNLYHQTQCLEYTIASIQYICFNVCLCMVNPNIQLSTIVAIRLWVLFSKNHQSYKRHAHIPKTQ